MRTMINRPVNIQRMEGEHWINNGRCSWGQFRSANSDTIDAEDMNQIESQLRTEGAAIVPISCGYVRVVLAES